VLEGYPDGTYKGKRNMTRYEFAVAIARIMDRVDAITAQAGAKGEKGEQGPPGPAGAGGGLTPEQQALLDRLANEFAPELKSLRSDLDALTKRVEELEANRVKPPVVTVSGNIGWRVGLYGTKLTGKEFADDTTGYPAVDFNGTDTFGVPLNVAFGTIPVVDPGTGQILSLIPVSDALKDSFKANSFMAMRSRLDFTATLGSNSSAFVSLLASPNTNIMDPGRMTSSLSVSPSAFSGNGIMDAVQMDQAYFSTHANFLAPVELKIGKQYLRRGEGLLFDNDQEALKGFRADFGSGSFRVGTFLAMLDPDEFQGRTSPIPFGLDQFGNAFGNYTRPESLVAKQLGSAGMYMNGQDQYRLFYADFEFVPGWRLGGNWLDTGFNKERGWSASLTGGLWGLDLYGEYARLNRWPNGLKFADANGNRAQDVGEVGLEDSDTAWLAGVRWNSKWLGITGEYGQIDAGYAFNPNQGGWDPIGDGGYFNLPLSAMHPRAEIDPYDINWVDRRLFLDPTNIAKGWHVGLNLPTVLGPKNPVSFSYATGDGYNPEYLGWLFSNGGSNQSPAVAAPDKWRDADPVWWVKLSHQMNESVSANLLYGRREVDNILSNGEVTVGGVAASTDPIQVLRAEVSVQF